jgi:S1-C subfamily serine protease
MYELKKHKNNNIFILFIIIMLVALFTIIAYTLFLDNQKYVYSDNVVGTKIYYQKEETSELDVILENTIECVVGVSKIKNTGTTIFLENSTENLGLGSGVIISTEGYILTNQHVAGEKYSICYITMQNGITDTGVVVWSSEDLDLAIIKINIKDLPEATLGDSENIKIGNKVYAIGNPVGYELQRTVTAGIISGTNRTIRIEDEDEKIYMESLIQTDATINQGNSGGPLINQNGEIIGITTIKIEDAEGIGFAIPINIVKPILKKLIERGNFDEPYLGILGYDKEAIPYLSSNISFETGIYISEIDNTGPLANSNLIEGDILEKIDDINIETMNQLKEYIYTKNVGDSVKLTIKRNKRKLEIDVTLGKK